MTKFKLKIDFYKQEKEKDIFHWVLVTLMHLWWMLSKNYLNFESLYFFLYFLSVDNIQRENSLTLNNQKFVFGVLFFISSLLPFGYFYFLFDLFLFSIFSMFFFFYFDRKTTDYFTQEPQNERGKFVFSDMIWTNNFIDKGKEKEEHKKMKKKRKMAVVK